MYNRFIGNQPAKDILKRLVSTARTPGALLFAGAAGVGKTSIAIELAKQLNCQQPTATHEACEVCRACRHITTLEDIRHARRDDKEREGIIWSGHRDVGLIVPAGRFIKVEVAREIEREAGFRPNEGKRRVLIIDEAERLNEAASNALLKTLEEMPATTHPILVTARPDALLITIRSRCQKIRFAPLTTDEIEAFLIKEKKRAGAEARLAARLANGDLSQALNLNLDDYTRTRSQTIEILEAVAARRDYDKLLKVSEEWTDAKRKDSFEMIFNAFEIVVRDVWRLTLAERHQQPAALSIINEDTRDTLTALAARFSSPQLAEVLRRSDELRRDLRVNINRRIAVDNLFVGA